jgi:hypothetical protein
MRKALTWIIGILVGLLIIAMVLFGASERQAYRIARGAISARVQTSQDAIDAAVADATASVDLALKMVGDLPSQQVKADLIKQDIEEIGNRLKDASQARGDAAIAQIDQSIASFNAALDKIDTESKQAENPEIKSALDRLYGVLLSVKEQLVQGILKTQQ